MSVAASSPFCGSKRYLESDQEAENFANFASGKRSRFVNSPAGGRCTPLCERQSYVVSASTLAALRGLFPEMDEETVSNVLRECGDDIDTAIRRLNDLKLIGATSTQPEMQAHNAVDAANCGDGARAAEQQGQQQPVGPVGVDLSPWVETVLQQMAEATNMDEARHRASSVVHALVGAVVESLGAKKHGDDEVEQLRAQAAELAKDNHILKRAVAIQNGRLQELAAKDGELAGMRQLCAQYQEKLHALELSNYSLALHLKQATSSADAQAHCHRHPDVF